MKQMAPTKKVRTYSKSNYSATNKSVDAVNSLFAKNITKRLLVKKTKRTFPIRELPIRKKYDSLLVDDSFHCSTEDTFDKLRIKQHAFSNKVPEIHISNFSKSSGEQSDVSSIVMTRQGRKNLLTSSFKNSIENTASSGSLYLKQLQQSSVDKIEDSLEIEKVLPKRNISLSYIKLNNSTKLSNTSKSFYEIKHKLTNNYSTPVAPMKKVKFLNQTLSPINKNSLLKETFQEIESWDSVFLPSNGPIPENSSLNIYTTSVKNSQCSILKQTCKNSSKNATPANRYSFITLRTRKVLRSSETAYKKKLSVSLEAFTNFEIQTNHKLYSFKESLKSQQSLINLITEGSDITRSKKCKSNSEGKINDNNFSTTYKELIVKIPRLPVNVNESLTSSELSFENFYTSNINSQLDRFADTKFSYGDNENSHDDFEKFYSSHIVKYTNSPEKLNPSSDTHFCPQNLNSTMSNGINSSIRDNQKQQISENLKVNLSNMFTCSEPSQNDCDFSSLMRESKEAVFENFYKANFSLVLTNAPTSENSEGTSQHVYSKNCRFSPINNYSSDNESHKKQNKNNVTFDNLIDKNKASSNSTKDKADSIKCKDLQVNLTRHSLHSEKENVFENFFEVYLPGDGMCSLNGTENQETKNLECNDSGINVKRPSIHSVKTETSDYSSAVKEDNIHKQTKLSSEVDVFEKFYSTNLNFHENEDDVSNKLQKTVECGDLKVDLIREDLKKNGQDCSFGNAKEKDNFTNIMSQIVHNSTLCENLENSSINNHKENYSSDFSLVSSPFELVDTSRSKHFEIFYRDNYNEHELADSSVSMHASHKSKRVTQENDETNSSDIIESSLVETYLLSKNKSKKLPKSINRINLELTLSSATNNEHLSFKSNVSEFDTKEQQNDSEAIASKPKISGVNDSKPEFGSSIQNVTDKEATIQKVDFDNINTRHSHCKLNINSNNLTVSTVKLNSDISLDLCVQVEKNIDHSVAFNDIQHHKQQQGLKNDLQVCNIEKHDDNVEEQKYPEGELTKHVAFKSSQKRKLVSKRKKSWRKISSSLDKRVTTEYNENNSDEINSEKQKVSIIALQLDNEEQQTFDKPSDSIEVKNNSQKGKLISKNTRKKILKYPEWKTSQKWKLKSKIGYYKHERGSSTTINEQLSAERVDTSIIDDKLDKSVKMERKNVDSTKGEIKTKKHSKINDTNLLSSKFEVNSQIAVHITAETFDNPVEDEISSKNTSREVVITGTIDNSVSDENMKKYGKRRKRKTKLSSHIPAETIDNSARYVKSQRKVSDINLKPSETKLSSQITSPDFQIAVHVTAETYDNPARDEISTKNTSYEVVTDKTTNNSVRYENMRKYGKRRKRKTKLSPHIPVETIDNSVTHEHVKRHVKSKRNVSDINLKPSEIQLCSQITSPEHVTAETFDASPKQECAMKYARRGRKKGSKRSDNKLHPSKIGTSPQIIPNEHVTAESLDSSPKNVKRKRGRPRKNTSSETTSKLEVQSQENTFGNSISSDSSYIQKRSHSDRQGNSSPVQTNSQNAPVKHITAEETLEAETNFEELSRDKNVKKFKANNYQTTKMTPCSNYHSTSKSKRRKKVEQNLLLGTSPKGNSEVKPVETILDVFTSDSGCGITPDKDKNKYHKCKHKRYMDGTKPTDITHINNDVSAKSSLHTNINSNTPKSYLGTDNMSRKSNRSNSIMSGSVIDISSSTESDFEARSILKHKDYKQRQALETSRKVSWRDENIASNTSVRKNSMVHLNNYDFKAPKLKSPNVLVKAGKSWKRSLSSVLRLSTAFVGFSQEEISTPFEGKACSADTLLGQRNKRNSRLSVRFVPLKPLPVLQTQKDISILEVYAAKTSYVPDQILNSNLEDGFRCLSINQGQQSRSSVHKNQQLGVPVTARDIVLRKCGQTEPVPFSECFPDSALQNCHKIGEGVYGEVFLYRNPNGGTSVLKIIPVEGDQIVNGERQKKFEEVLSEIIITYELSNLRNNERNGISAFTELQKVQCVRGRYPEKLLYLWDLFDETRGSENDCPDLFGEDQLYIVFQMAYAGQDLESFIFNSAMQAYAMFQQVALALATAEKELRFEHRDLHWGNVLLNKVEANKMTSFILENKTYVIPTMGVEISIIDYTLSRIEQDGVVIFNDLGLDPDLFTAEGDYQFEIYRLMQQKNGNNWKEFEPFSNILWLDYILDKALLALRYKNTKTKRHKEYLHKLKVLKEDILSYHNVKDYVVANLLDF